MASSPAQPSTPSEPRRTLLNRSFTVPTKLTTPSPRSLNGPAEIGATEGVETLYVHPNANIIKFTSASRPSSSTKSTSNTGDPSQGTLSWSSPTERTMAAGPLEIYRVPGSVSFLHSGALLHAILPRSNCWCVDGVSKFALRVLPDTYYRIELPGETEEDLRAVEELKGTLRKVLFFERTPCPFARGFEPEVISDEPEVEEVVEEASIEEAEVRGRRVGKAKKWRLQGGRSWRPEGWVEPEEGEGSERASEEEEDGEEESDEGSREDASEIADEVAELSVSTPTRPQISTGFRSVTAPSPSTLRGPAQSSSVRTRVDVDGTVEAIERVEQRRIAQLEPPRMRSLQAIPTDMPPSPPDSSAGADYVEGEFRTRARAVEDPSIETQEPAIPAERAVKPPPLEDIRESSPPSQGASDDERENLVTPEAEVDAALEQSEHDDEPQEGTPVEDDSKGQDSIPVTRDGQPQEATPFEPEELAQATSGADAPIPNPNLVAQHPEPSGLSPQPTTTNTERPTTPDTQTGPQPEDPYAAIQARILARRTIGTPTASLPRKFSTSSSTTSSTLSRRSTNQNHRAHHQQAFTTALLQRTCAVFLGPPARLVAIMLKIAARYADAAFGVGSPFYVESPRGEAGKVPGSFLLVGEGVGRQESESEGEEEDEEDDFGVPLRSPVRIAGLSGGGGLRERRAWDVD